LAHFFAISSVISEKWVQSPGEINVVIVPHCRV